MPGLTFFGLSKLSTSRFCLMSLSQFVPRVLTNETKLTVLFSDFGDYFFDSKMTQTYNLLYPIRRGSK